MIIDANCESGGKRTRIYFIDHIKNATIFSPPYESIQAFEFYSSSLSSLNIPYSLLSDDKLNTNPLGVIQYPILLYMLIHYLHLFYLVPHYLLLYYLLFHYIPLHYILLL